MSAALSGQVAQAGDLRSFEQAATSGGRKAVPPRGSAPSGPVLNRSHGGCLSDSLAGCLVEQLFIGPFVDLTGMLTMMSMARVGAIGAAAAAGVEPREVGDPDLPYAAVDLGIQRVSSVQTTTDARAEIGFGAFAVVVRNTRYRETISSTTTGGELSVRQSYGLFRMAPSRTFQLGVGVGESVLSGQRETVGTSLTAPISVCPDRDWCLRLLPTWNSYPGGGKTTEYDWSVAWTQPWLSLRLGYRWVNSGVEVLQGPTAGLTLHF
jgi:hypothetical protein